jgi:hypothetical protein
MGPLLHIFTEGYLGCRVVYIRHGINDIAPYVKAFAIFALTLHNSSVAILAVADSGLRGHHQTPLLRSGTQEGNSGVVMSPTDTNERALIER